VNGEAFDSENFQAEAGEQGLKRGDREIEDVLVIDGVEFGVFDEIDRVGKFEDNTAFRLQERFQAADELVGVGCVGEDVVAEDQVSFFAGGDESVCDVVAEKFDESFDAFFAGDFGDVGGRLDAEAGNPGLRKVLQQITVVAGDFDDVALIIQREFPDVTFNGFACVTEQRVGKRRKIKVFREQSGRGHEVGDLEEPAGLADGEAEGEFGLTLGDVLRSQEIVGEGLEAEVQEEFAIGRIAGAAVKRDFR
jgi:hypothetical protein